jgi:hypothetical protein
MELAEYYLPSHWAVALINGDESCFDMDDPMDDHSDYKTYQKFCAEMDKKHHSWWAVDCDEESQFMKWHHVQHLGVLASDCHKVLIQIPTEE